MASPSREPGSGGVSARGVGRTTRKAPSGCPEAPYPPGANTSSAEPQASGLTLTTAPGLCRGWAGCRPSAEKPGPLRPGLGPH